MTTYLELKKQAEDLLHQAEAARKAEIGAALAEIKSKMAMYGITIDDIAGRARAAKGRKAKGTALTKPGRKAGKAAKAEKPAKQRKPVAAKFRNGETGETWSGRGKAPKWLMAMEATGRKREEFALSQG